MLLNFSFEVNPQMSNKDLYDAGFDGFCDGQPFDKSMPVAWQQGWRFANHCQAQADTGLGFKANAAIKRANSPTWTTLLDVEMSIEDDYAGIAYPGLI